MAAIKHAKTNTRSPTSDPTAIQPADWNDEHVITGDVDMGTHKITNLVDPVAAQDAATKNYVDTHGGGGGGGITNSAPNNVLMKSNGTNAVASIISEAAGTAGIAGGLLVGGNAEVDGNFTLSSNGDPQVFSTKRGTNAVGLNLWIGGGGQVSIGDPVNTFWGSHNTSLGSSALQSCTTGWENVCVGWVAGNQITTGAQNIAIGCAALQNTTTGGPNIAMCSDALRDNTTGSGNVALGSQSMLLNITGGNNIAVGGNTLAAATASTNNIAIGASSMSSGSTPGNSVGIGTSTLIANAGDNNIAVGTLAGTAITSGTDNVAIGKSALSTCTTSSFNTAIGKNALAATNGTQNVAIGALTLQSSTGNYNTCVGHVAGFNLTTGAGNTIIGTGPSGHGGGITTGSNNTIIGGSVTGLSSSLSNNIILADGAGNQRLNIDSSGNTKLAGTLQIAGAGPKWSSGAGSPNTVVTGSPGDLYSNTSGGAGTTLYVKESGVGTNTGWVGK